MNAAVRATALVVCLSIVSAGCAKRSHGLIVAGVGLAGLIATGIAIKQCNDDGGCDSIILILPVPVAVTLGGVLGAATAKSPRSSVHLPLPEARPPPVDEPPVGSGSGSGQAHDPSMDDDNQAVGLTERARTAAIAGQCEDVRAFAPRVEREDPTYYRAVFLADLAIVRCLNATAGPTPDAAPAPAPSPDAAPSDAR